MSPKPKKPVGVAPEERVTLDQLKHRVEEISNLAVIESKRVAADVYEQNATRALLVAVGVVVVAASFAYFLGSRNACRAGDATLPPGY